MEIKYLINLISIVGCSFGAFIILFGLWIWLDKRMKKSKNTKYESKVVAPDYYKKYKSIDSELIANLIKNKINKT